jgi:hypothetical protein
MSGGVLREKIGQKIDKQHMPRAITITSSLHIATFVAFSVALALIGTFPARTAGQATKADNDLAGTWKGELGARRRKTAYCSGDYEGRGRRVRRPTE